MSKKSWDRLTPDQQRAVEEAADVADAYFETSQIEAEKRALAAFHRAGATVRSISRQEYMAWLALAQRTAWADYVRASPASRDLLHSAIRVILSELGTKEEVISSLFGAAHEDK
jgi:TRAP-type C4-dicarboxylate transport system substrate-binding protein